MTYAQNILLPYQAEMTELNFLICDFTCGGDQ